MPLKVIVFLVLTLTGPVVIAVSVFQFYQEVSKPDLVTLNVPAVKPFRVVEPGKHTIWNLVSGPGDDGTFRTRSKDLPEGVEFSVRNSDSEAIVPLERSTGTSIETGKSHKTSLATAELLPGQYQLIAHGPEDSVTLVLSRNTEFSVFVILIGGILVGSLVFLCGL